MYSREVKAVELLVRIQVQEADDLIYPQALDTKTR